MSLSCEILGPLTVRSARGPVALAGARTRALATALVLERNRPVDAERLAIAVWGENASHANAIRVQISRLRAALGEPAALVTTPAGYQLNVSSLDADRFDALVRDGRDLPPALAAERLREALSLWRGPALADVAHDEFVRFEVARLEEQRLAALELRIDADLACGRHAELVGELRELTARHPLRERLHGQLMLSLYRSGRQADALTAYREARTRLRDELGLEPGPQLRTLERAILRHDDLLETAPAPARVITPGVDQRPARRISATRGERVVRYTYVGALAAPAARVSQMSSR